MTNHGGVIATAIVLATSTTAGLAIAQAPPLLGSSHAKPYWESFCEGQVDATALPPDPRTLVRPGANEDRAVYFNAYWEDCHANLPPEEQAPTTCGEYRERRDRGRATLFEVIPSGSRSAADFDNQWQVWGLEEKPPQDEFERMVTLRYGLNPAPFRNPYPVDGQDPNATNGGEGQLPLGYRQNRNPDGTWTGTISSTACLYCHGGMIGEPGSEELDAASLEGFGAGNANLDVIMSGHDANQGFPILLPAFSQGAEAAFALGIDQRGHNNAVFGFEILAAILDKDSLDVRPHVDYHITHNSSGAQDSPAWWNVSHRPRKFFDAGVSMDSHRIIMAAGTGAGESGGNPFGKNYRDLIEKHDSDLAAFFDSLRSPQYPGPVDEELAGIGATIFHTLDLWNRSGNANRQKPAGGNGSCASCHGAYSPRYVNDPAFLEDPSLEGVAGHIVPLDLIGTDSSRADNLTPYYRDQFGRTFWGYPDGVEGWTAPEDKDPVTEFVDDEFPDRPIGLCTWETGVIGYLAPPLYGVWATAPYFHNGSVPTVEQVLDPSTRPQIWRRALQQIGPVVGFDQRFDVAYDPLRLGWKHEVLSCEDRAGYDEVQNCSVADPQSPSVLQVVLNVIKENLNLAAAITTPELSEDGIENRLIFDSRKVGNRRSGHEFTDVLTAAEREAVIEYLKTL